MNSQNFIHYLQGMVNDRGKLATLRKGLVNNQAEATWPLLGPWLDFDKPHQFKALQTIAGLYGHHSNHVEGVNFGRLCHQLLDEDELDKMSKGETGPISKRFQYTLAADGEEIFQRVRPLVLRAKRDDIPVDYVQLLEDVLAWGNQRKEKVKLSWGKEFWRMSRGNNAETDVNEDSVND